MSITDGQVVLQPPISPSPAAGDAASSRVPLETNVDPRASISRIGSRAHPPALATLAPELRFNLAQVGAAVSNNTQSTLRCTCDHVAALIPYSVAGTMKR